MCFDDCSINNAFIPRKNNCRIISREADMDRKFGELKINEEERQSIHVSKDLIKLACVHSYRESEHSFLIE